MKKTIFLITFLAICLSCKKENIKSDFFGNWSSTSDTNAEIDIMFFKDSMVIDNSIMYGTYSLKWKIRGSKIEQTLLRGDSSILNNKNISNYEFNYNKDTLVIKHKSDSTRNIKFRKIKNGYEYFENKIGLEIKLKTVSEKPISAGNNDYNFNIYLALKNNKIIAKTDYSNNLNNLAFQLFNFKSQISEKDWNRLKYVLFIDKNVSNKKIDSIKSLFIKEIVEKVFIVKNYKENKWNEPINWLGVYED